MMRHTIPGNLDLYPVILRPLGVNCWDVSQRRDPRCTSYGSLHLGEVEKLAYRNWTAQRYNGSRYFAATKAEVVDWLRQRP
jgi:hypothetical protein